MAQLDFVTYVHQFSWLAVCFFIFYIILLQLVFPAISAALKGRSKKQIITRKNNYSKLQYMLANSRKYSTYWDGIFKLQDRQIKFFQIQQTMLRLRLSENI
jgi:hypothetical protein